MRKPKPTKPISRGGTTREDLTQMAQKRPKSMQRVRIVLEVDIADENYSRDDVNEAAIRIATDFPGEIELDGSRVQVVLLTTEEVER